MLIKSSTCLKTTSAPSGVSMSELEEHSRLVSTVSSFKDSSVKSSDLCSTLRMSSWGQDATKMRSSGRILTHCRNSRTVPFLNPAVISRYNGILVGLPNVSLSIEPILSLCYSTRR